MSNQNRLYDRYFRSKFKLPGPLLKFALITPWRIAAVTNEDKWIQEWTEAVDWFHNRVRDVKNFIRRNALPVSEFSQNRSITSQNL